MFYTKETLRAPNFISTEDVREEKATLVISFVIFIFLNFNFSHSSRSRQDHLVTAKYFKVAFSNRLFLNRKCPQPPIPPFNPNKVNKTLQVLTDLLNRPCTLHGPSKMTKNFMSGLMNKTNYSILF